MALTAVEEAQLRDLIAQQSALLSLAGVEATILSKLGATKVTLSDLPSAVTIDDADLLLLRQGTTDKSVTGATLKGLIPTIADASTTVKGIVELATDAETQTGTDAVRAVTPASLQSKVASETAIGLVELATDAEAQAFTANKFIDGEKLATAFKGSNQSLAASGYQKFPGGLIVMMGTVTVGISATNVVVTLPITLPVEYMCALAIRKGTAAPTSDDVTLCQQTSLSQLTIWPRAALASSRDFTYLVIGH